MILNQFRLDSRVALVTGASRGLGQAMAKGLAEAGAHIAGISRSGDMEETRSLVEAADRRLHSMQADLTVPEQRQGLVDRVVEEMGRIDILVNNAGTTARHPPEDYPMDNWRSLMELHVSAAFDLSQQAAPHFFRRGRGKIVNVGSVLSIEGGWHIPAYATAKHGVAGLTKSLATAWSGYGVNVNCIVPGYFETDLTDPLRNDPGRGREILGRIPCGRWGQPDELAPLVVFLASEASNYMHGSVVPIDGGWLAR